MKSDFQHSALLVLCAGVLAQPVPRSVEVVRTSAVSAQHLEHKPPKNARREFDRGLRALQDGHGKDAVQHFLAATNSDPDYLEAQAYLGEELLREGEAVQGLEHIERALLTEPSSDVLHANRSAALLMLQRPVEAEQAARRAVQLAPASVAAHYMLGIALLRQNQATEETAEHLEIAVSKYPDVRPGLTWVRERLGALGTAKPAKE